MYCVFGYTLDWNSPYTAVYITTQTLNNIYFHYFIINHSHPILLYIINEKQNFIQNIFNIMKWMWHSQPQMYSGIKNITLQMAGLPAETCWWKYYKYNYTLN